MKNENLYEKLFMKLYNAIDYMMKSFEQKDSERNRTNYGSATAYGSVLRELGYDVEIPAYEKDGYLVVDWFKINDKKYDFFHS